MFARAKRSQYGFSCHRSAVLFIVGLLSGAYACTVGFAYRLHPRLCSGHAYGVLSYTMLSVFGHRCAVVLPPKFVAHRVKIRCPRN